MKIIILAFCILFICCNSYKINQKYSEGNAIEHWIYRNYGEIDTLSIKMKNISNLDEINFNDLHKINNIDIKNHTSLEEVFKVKDFFYKDGNSDLNVHLLYKIRNPNLIQYLGYIEIVEKTFFKNIYLIITVDNHNQIKSVFAARLFVDTGFDSETQEVTLLDENNYQLKVYGWSDTGGKFEYSDCFQMTKDGFIDTSVQCVDLFYKSKNH